MTATNDQPNPPPEPETITVPAARLAWGEWSNQKQRQIAEGDISISYSADVIPEGKIRKPFRWEGGLCVCVGSSGLHGRNEASAYRLIPAKLFTGKATTYAEKTRDGDEARADPNGFYDRIVVKSGGENWILVGPPLRFVAEGPERPEAGPAQMNLFGEIAP